MRTYKVIFEELVQHWVPVFVEVKAEDKKSAYEKVKNNVLDVVKASEVHLLGDTDTELLESTQTYDFERYCEEDVKGSNNSLYMLGDLVKLKEDLNDMRICLPSTDAIQEHLGEIVEITKVLDDSVYSCSLGFDIIDMDIREKVTLPDSGQVMRVCYMPSLSAVLVKQIRENINASMVSDDGSTEQYQLEMIMELDVDSIVDRKMLKNLLHQGTGYIEL